MRKATHKASGPSYEDLKKENLKLKKNIAKYQKEVEPRLIEKETYLRTVIESLPFDVFALDEKGRYAMQNSTCRNHWGDIIGKRPKDIGVDRDTLALWENNNRRAFSGRPDCNRFHSSPFDIIDYGLTILSHMHLPVRISWFKGDWFHE